MRKLGIAVAIIVIIFLVIVFALPSFINVNSYHDRIQAELQQKLGRKVSLGQLHLSIIPLSFSAENAVIGEDPGFHSGRPFAQAQQIDVSPDFWPLLQGKVQISSVELKQPKIELIRDAQGAWNFASLSKSNAKSSAGKTQAATNNPPETAVQNQEPSSSSQNISLQDLKITDGQVALTDYQKRQPRALYDHIDAELQGYAPGKAFDISVAAHLPGQGDQVVKLSGTTGPIDNANPANTPFKGTLELQQVSLAGVDKFLNSQSLAGMEAVVSGKTDISSSAGKFDSNGSLKLNQVRIHGNEIGYPINADYAFNDDLNSGKLSIEKGKLKLGSTPVSISGTVETKPTPMQLDVKLNASDVSIQEAARLAAALGVAFNPGMNIGGKLTADVHAQGPATKPAMNGKLKASNLSVSGKDLKSPVKIPAIDLALTPNEIRSNEFTASTGGTSVNAQFTLTRYTTPSPNVDATIKTGNANLGELLNIANAYGVSAANGVSGSGTISLDLHAMGPIKNSSALTFSGSGALQNATLKTPSLTEPLKVRNANLKFSQNSAALDNLSASLGSTNATGALTLRNFAAPQVQFTLAADKVNVNEIQKIFGAAPQKAALDVKQGFWNLTPSASATTTPQASLLNKATGGGSIKVGNIIYNDLTLNNVNSKVTLDRGIIRLDPTTAQLAGGQETGAIVVDTRANPTSYKVNAKLAQVDANKLLSSVSSIKQTLFGLLAANTNASFDSGTPNIAQTLNGTFGLNLVNGKLANVDLLYELANIGKFLTSGKAISQHSFTTLSKLSGNFNVKNGVANTNDLQAIIDGGKLSAVGLVNLADQGVNMHMTAVLTKGMTQSVGNIGGLLTTALENRQGELVMPVLVTGTMNHPHVAPDVEKIAQMKLQNLLPTSANPGALSSGILGGLLGNKSGQGGAQSGGGLQGILGAMGGKQQPAQPSPQGAQAAPAPNGQPQPNAQQQPTLGGLLNGILNKKKQPPPPNPPPK